MERRTSETENYIQLEAVEAYLKSTDTVASRLSMAATGSPNYVSMMRHGKALAAKHRRTILRYMDAHPDGPPKIPRCNKGGRPKGSTNGTLSPSTAIPVPGPSQLHPDLFGQIKAEAFRRGQPVAAFMEHIMKLGWLHYQTPRQEAA